MFLSDESLENGNCHTSFKLKDTEKLEETDSQRNLRRRMVFRNRWHVALTLTRNPSIKKYRSPSRDMKLVSLLMKEMRRRDEKEAIDRFPLMKTDSDNSESDNNEKVYTNKCYVTYV